MANRNRSTAKERHWREIVAKHAASGLSVRAFCRREQLAENSFYAWRRTLAERDGEVESRQRAPAFVPMRVADRPAREASIEMELVGGRVLRLPESISAERLAELLVALEARGGR